VMRLKWKLILDVKSCFDPSGDGVTVGEVRCTVCAKHTIGSGTILDASDGTPRSGSSSGSSFRSICRYC
jgi:hypothetical protein